MLTNQAMQSIPKTEGWQLRNVPLHVKRKAQAQAKIEGRSESELVGEALEQYLSKAERKGK